ncbi:MAG: radical SAM protein [Acidilobus sp.]|nr:radical SAM protein [Acidilobus sp.]
MIPVSVMVTGRGTVSERIKGRYGPGRPSAFSSELRPVVFWNITYLCNLRCAHCYINAGPEPRREELSRDDLLRVAREIADLGLPLVIFSGGEPLMRRDFWDVAQELSGRDRPKLALSTNGTLITRDVARRLSSLGFSYVGVSLDSLVAELHDRFRGVKGAFEATISGIRNAVEAGLDVGIRTTVTRWNYMEAPGMVDLAYRLGARRVSYYILDSIGRARAIVNDLPSHEQLREFAEALIGKAREYEGKVEIEVVRSNFIGIYLADRLSGTVEEFQGHLSLIGGQGDCGRKTISIYPDGTVRPCQFIDQFVIGDLRRQGLREVLSPQNEALARFVRLYEGLRGPRCGKCPFKVVCGGGSRGRAEALTGDFWGDDPLCFIDPWQVARRWGMA